MSLGVQAALAFAPILLAGVLLVGLRWPARRAMPVVYLVTVVIALSAWGVELRRVMASTIQGLGLTAAILWIVFGAILLLNTNMIAIHNIVAAAATGGLLGSEGLLLRRTILPTVHHCVFAGVIGLVAYDVLGVTDVLA